MNYSESKSDQSSNVGSYSEDDGKTETEEIEQGKGQKHCDGRTKQKLSFMEKWERMYPWSYYSSAKGGWVCTICLEYSDSHDDFWKTLARKHNEHPGVFFRDHENF